MSAGNPNTFIVGAGPVAIALAGALRTAGNPVLGLWARNPAAARTASAVAGVASFSAAPPDLLLEAEVAILAVRDEAISSVAQMLVATGLISRRHVMLHCSGAIPASEAFAAVRPALGGIGALHPLRAIADGSAAMAALAGTVFGIEGDERGVAVARQLTRLLGGRPLELSGAQMAAYHTAAAIASNYAVALIDAACVLLSRAGIDEDDALAALIPLARGSLDTAGRRGLVDGLTGPIRRGDVETVARHLSAIGDDRELASLYRALGRRAIALADRAGGLSDETRRALAAHLDAVESTGRGT